MNVKIIIIKEVIDKIDQKEVIEEDIEAIDKGDIEVEGIGIINLDLIIRTDSTNRRRDIMTIDKGIININKGIINISKETTITSNVTMITSNETTITSNETTITNNEIMITNKEIMITNKGIMRDVMIVIIIKSLTKNASETTNPSKVNNADKTKQTNTKIMLIVSILPVNTTIVNNQDNTVKIEEVVVVIKNITKTNNEEIPMFKSKDKVKKNTTLKMMKRNSHSQKPKPRRSNQRMLTIC